jgi:hypothetical protein
MIGQWRPQPCRPSTPPQSTPSSSTVRETGRKTPLSSIMRVITFCTRCTPPQNGHW